MATINDRPYILLCGKNNIGKLNAYILWISMKYSTSTLFKSDYARLQVDNIHGAFSIVPCSMYDIGSFKLNKQDNKNSTHISRLNITRPLLNFCPKEVKDLAVQRRDFRVKFIGTLVGENLQFDPNEAVMQDVRTYYKEK